MLTSSKNPQIQRIRKIQRSARTRRKEGRFIVEGVRLVEEALIMDRHPELLLFSENLNESGQKIVDRFRAQYVRTIMVSSQVMQAASDTETPQGLLAVLPIPEWEIPKNPAFVLIPDGVRDPGNLGTLLRTALAAGVDLVLLPPGCVDVYSPKVVRSGMGAQLSLPTHPMSWEDIEGLLAGLNVFLADSTKGTIYFETELRRPLAMIIGGEAGGAGSQATQLANQRVHIPMAAKSESLNAAIAGAILMYEVVRQRG